MLVMPNEKMPAGCELCPCYYDGWCNLIPGDDRLPYEYAYSKEKRDLRCPLIYIDDSKRVDIPPLV